MCIDDGDYSMVHMCMYVRKPKPKQDQKTRQKGEKFRNLKLTTNMRLSNTVDFTSRFHSNLSKNKEKKFNSGFIQGLIESTLPYVLRTLEHVSSLQFSKTEDKQMFQCATSTCWFIYFSIGLQCTPTFQLLLHF